MRAITQLNSRIELTPDLVERQQRWVELEGDRAKQDELYAKEFAEPFARLFAELPLYNAPAELPRPRALISLLGFSWQPVALMASWCRPEKMLVLGTKDSLIKSSGGEGILSLVARVAAIPRHSIVASELSEHDEASIYKAVRDFIKNSQLGPREIFLDTTGGKKSMTAPAALASFVAGIPIVYVDYHRYDGRNRIPLPGTEYPRLLTNPLEVMGDLELRDIFAAFNRSDFHEAQRLARQLAERLYSPREAECLACLAKAYGAWDGFAFQPAYEELCKAQRKLVEFRRQGAWSWLPDVDAKLAKNLAALQDLAATQKRPADYSSGAPLLAWYLSAARRALKVGKFSLAVVLTYAAMERYLDLCLWLEFKLDDEEPDYSVIQAQFSQERYNLVGRELHGKSYKPRELDGPLMFTNGLQLLVTLQPERLGITANDDACLKRVIGQLRGLAAARNKCEYEHGFLPVVPTAKDAQKFLTYVEEFLAPIDADAGGFMQRLEACTFPVLPTT